MSAVRRPLRSLVEARRVARGPGSRRRASALALAGVLGAAGVTHFLRPALYAPIVPSPFGDPYPWVYGSGLAELACAAGIATPRARRVAAWAAAALFVLVFPANVQMALDASERSTTYQVMTYARLPLQVPLVLWAVVVARSSEIDQRRSNRAGEPCGVRIRDR
jgi:uncharacterized membrane protein